jgi:hypothetical protein
MFAVAYIPPAFVKERAWPPYKRSRTWGLVCLRQDSKRHSCLKMTQISTLKFQRDFSPRVNHLEFELLI